MYICESVQGYIRRVSLKTKVGWVFFPFFLFIFLPGRQIWKLDFSILDYEINDHILGVVKYLCWKEGACFFYDFMELLKQHWTPFSQSLQWLSCVQLFEAPWTAAHQASLSITNCHSLLKLMSSESVMPSNHLILCQSLLLLPSIFPSIRVFSSESALHIKVLEFQLQHQSFQWILRTDFL